MSRLLLIGFAIWLAWRLLRGLHIQVGPIAPPRPPSSPGQPNHYEPMARCARCGTHLPASSLSKSGLCGRCSG